MCGKILRDRISNENVQVVPIEDMMRGIRWFGHIYHRSSNVVVRRSDMATVEGSTKGRSRPNLIVEVVVRNYLGFLNIIERNMLNRIKAPLDLVWPIWLNGFVLLSSMPEKNL